MKICNFFKSEPDAQKCNNPRVGAGVLAGFAVSQYALGTYLLVTGLLESPNYWTMDNIAYGVAGEILGLLFTTGAVILYRASHSTEIQVSIYTDSSQDSPEHYYQSESYAAINQV